MLLSFQTREDNFWSKKGYEIAFDQLELPWKVNFIETNQDASPWNGLPISGKHTSKIQEINGKVIASGKNFAYEFDKITGSLISMNYHGVDLISKGPELNVWRAPLANETDSWANGSSNLTDRGLVWDPDHPITGTILD